MQQLLGLPMSALSPARSSASSTTGGNHANALENGDFSQFLASSHGDDSTHSAQRFSAMSTQKVAPDDSAALKDDWLAMIEGLNSNEDSDGDSDATKLSALLQKHQINPQQLEALLATLSDDTDMSAWLADIESQAEALMSPAEVDALITALDEISGKDLPAANQQHVQALIEQLPDEHPVATLVNDFAGTDRVSALLTAVQEDPQLQAALHAHGVTVEQIKTALANIENDSALQQFLAQLDADAPLKSALASLDDTHRLQQQLHELDEAAELQALLSKVEDDLQSLGDVPARGQHPSAEDQLNRVLTELPEEHPLKAFLADIAVLPSAERRQRLDDLAPIMVGAPVSPTDDKAMMVGDLERLLQEMPEEDAQLLLDWLNVQRTVAQLEQEGLEASDNNVDLSQLRQLLAQWLQQTAEPENAEADEDASQSGQQLTAQLTQLLNQLKQHDGEAEAPAARTASSATNQLSAVAQSISQASQQLRDQIQAALQQQNSDADGDEQTLSVEQIRRLVADGTQTTQGELRPAQPASQQQTTLNNSWNSAMQSARESTPAQQAATQQQSAYEAARQAQQAIDILGPQAPERLRERVAVMFNSRTQAAEMRLDPPDLGRLNIRLNMNQEQASVSFQVSNPQAREVIEQSLPRLRELLAEQGIELADANVSEQQNQQQRDADSGSQRTANAAASDSQALNQDDIDSEQMEWVDAPGASSDGRVDYFV